MAEAGVIAGPADLGISCIGGIGGRLGATGLGGVIATWSGIQLSKKILARQSEVQTDV